ncbi:hypothetical protein GQ607_000222 [Colletotrichum asianum]|uniref:Uncharacterized protein n=1 Tax=Colletotrichum asianum TaxID=702518 RepID=A0A8H3WP87_9PEZI|nr:hypothetical protein GQ607_000222 [Colletotrichum asianum]
MSQLMSKGPSSLLTCQLLESLCKLTALPYEASASQVLEATDLQSPTSFCGQSPASTCQPNASLIPAALGPVLAGDGEGGPDTSGLRCWAGGQQHKWLCTRCLATGSTDKLAKVAVYAATQRKQHWSV